MHTHQRIVLCIVAGVDGDAEYAGLCGFYAVGYLHYGAIELGGGYRPAQESVSPHCRSCRIRRASGRLAAVLLPVS